eukprot:CAMPEP_0184648550 /NCGR_PEP_ID=MMETSP0308-20130426/5690_1 /TAXON_ID=38269 /ORGANISM="Gloeochaete witrockiana, Strain SAG 46.84" /LENGTH=994 /DNA_ID=CAMNT_0027080465 /DNA_START=183 /DNA_END=3167 /DNA_ORIENTATION=-
MFHVSYVLLFLVVLSSACNAGVAKQVISASGIRRFDLDNLRKGPNSPHRVEVPKLPVNGTRPPRRKAPPEASTAPGKKGPQEVVKSRLRPESASEGFQAFPGIHNLNSIRPPDQALCVGDGYVIQGVNQYWKFQYQDGSPLSDWPDVIYINQLFSENEGYFLFDPVCYFDRDTGRFIVVSTGIEGDTRSRLYIAWNEVLGSLKTWKSAYFQTDNVGGYAGCFQDYPQLGVSSTGFFITTNVCWIYGGCASALVWSMSKGIFQTSYPAGGSPLMQFTLYDSGWSSVVALKPPLGEDYADSALSDAVFMARSSGSDIRLRAFFNIRGLSADGGNLTLSNEISLDRSLRGYQPIPQNMGIAPKCNATEGFEYFDLDVGDGRLSNTYWANGRLYITWPDSFSSLGETTMGVRVLIVSPHLDGRGVLTAEIIRDQLITGESGVNLFYPSVAVNTQGDGVLVVSIAGPGIFPTFGWFQIKNSTSIQHPYTLAIRSQDYYYSLSYDDPSRWGDYSTAAFADSGEAWMAGEIVSSDIQTSDCQIINWGTALARQGEPSYSVKSEKYSLSVNEAIRVRYYSSSAVAPPTFNSIGLFLTHTDYTFTSPVAQVYVRGSYNGTVIFNVTYGGTYVARYLTMQSASSNSFVPMAADRPITVIDPTQTPTPTKAPSPLPSSRNPLSTPPAPPPAPALAQAPAPALAPAPAPALAPGVEHEALSAIRTRTAFIRLTFTPSKTRYSSNTSIFRNSQSPAPVRTTAIRPPSSPSLLSINSTPKPLTPSPTSSSSTITKRSPSSTSLPLVKKSTPSLTTIIVMKKTPTSYKTSSPSPSYSTPTSDTSLINIPSQTPVNTYTTPPYPYPLKKNRPLPEKCFKQTLTALKKDDASSSQWWTSKFTGQLTHLKLHLNLTKEEEDDAGPSARDLAFTVHNPDRTRSLKIAGADWTPLRNGASGPKWKVYTAHVFPSSMYGSGLWRIVHVNPGHLSRTSILATLQSTICYRPDSAVT